MTTPDRRILPAAQAVLVDRAGRATPPFYDLLRRIVDTTALTPELVDEVKQILEQIENLPTEGFMPITSRVVGQDSIEWQGLLANGLTTLRLYGDTSDQRSTWYYGTNSSNEKGWYRFYDALDTGAGILKRNSGYVELGEVDDPADLPDSGNAGEAYWVRGEGDIEERGLWVWDADAGEWALDTEASGIVGFEIAEGDYGDISVSDEGATWTINENAVTDEKLRDSAALSVIGRASDSTGDPADIAASADKAVLHRDGDALSFSPIDHTYISDFAEAAQDAVGGILTDSADIEFTYDDGNDEITAVLSAAVHSSLALADTAVQPGDLAAVAFSGDYGDLSNTPSIPADLSGLTFITVDDETSLATNSRQLIAGTNITFDTSTPGRLEISASGGGGGGQVNSIVEGFGILVDDTDPENPIVAVDEAMSPIWTGLHAISRNSASITSWRRTGVTSNQGGWLWQVEFTGALRLETLNDAGVASGVFPLRFTRSGTDVPIMSTASSVLEVNGTPNPQFRSVNGTVICKVQALTGSGLFGTESNHPLELRVNNTIRAAIDTAGRLYGTALHNNASLPTGTTNHYIASGTYTPTLTNVSNAGSLTAAVCQWVRVGNVVTVSGSATVTPSSSGVVRIGITLPIGSGLTASNQLAGTGCGEDGDIARVYGDATNDRAEIRIGLAFASTVSFHFTYLIL